MPIAMTRVEYQAKFGVAPVLPSASKVDTSVAPRRMTQAEYDAEFNPPKQTTGGFIGGMAGEAISNLGTTYSQLPSKLAQDVQAGAQDIQAGHPIKGVTKSAARTAGDVAGAVYAPIGAAIEATGANKLFDFLGGLSQKGKYNPINMLTDIPAVQEWATKHPNAAEDFGRAMNIALGAADKGTIKPKTAIPRTVNQVKTGADSVKTTLQDVKTQYRTNKNTKTADNVAKELFNIENSYSTTRKANEFSTDSGAASRERIAKTNVLNDAVDSEGTIRTKTPGGAVDQYKAQTIDGVEGVVRQNVAREGKTVNLKQVERGLILEVNKSGLEGADLIAALNGVKKEISGLKLRADTFGNIALEKVHDAKINTTKNINYNTPPETATYRKAVARGYKKLVEDNSSFNVSEVNAELTKYYEDVERLESLDGKKVKGGKLGKYVAQVSGNIVGGAIGSAVGGGVGMAAGTLVGGETAAFLKGKAMAKTFGKNTGEAPKNPILEKAKETGKLPPERKLTVADQKVGVASSIPKTKEVYQLEAQITKNVEAQKAAIKKGDFTLVAALKEIYDNLVAQLKDVIKKIKETQGKQGGFIKNPLASSSPKSGIPPEKGIKQVKPSPNPATPEKAVKAHGVDNTLLTEARKYKTAEEFVKAQKVVYHGSPFKGLSNLDNGEFAYRGNSFTGKNTKVKPNAIYFSENPDVAKFFGTDKAQGLKEMNIKTGVLKVEPTVYERYLKSKKTLDLTSIEKADKFLYDNKLMGEIESSLGEAPIGDQGLLDMIADSDSDIKVEDLWNLTDNKKIVDTMKKLGYDTVKLKETGDRGISYAVLDKNSLLTKSQLTDIWKKAHGVDNTLLTEARKYKTAEKFVKAQTNAYHATTKDFNEFKLPTTRNGLGGARATFLSETPEGTKYYQFNDKSKVVESSISRDAKIFDYKKEQNIIDEFVDKAVKNNTAWNESQKRLLKNGDWGNIESEPFQKFLKSKGYDGFRVMDMTGHEAIGITNMDKIKTKSQLTDIWKKANKK